MEASRNNPWHGKSADEDRKEAAEWLQKTEQLEIQYHEELAAAGNDEQKKIEVVRRIADQVGMPPRLAVGVMNRPIVSMINHYYMNVKAADPTPSQPSISLWTCKMCGTDNDGVFCKTCGAKRP